MNRSMTLAVSAVLLVLGVVSAGLLAAPGAATRTPPAPPPNVALPPVPVDAPNLHVTLRADKRQVDHNAEFVVLATVRNAGAAGAAGVALRLKLDEAAFVNITTPANRRGNFVCSAAVGAHEVNCTGGRLRANGDTTLRFKVRAPAQVPAPATNPAATPDRNAPAPTIMMLTLTLDPARAVAGRNHASTTAAAIVRVAPSPN